METCVRGFSYMPEARVEVSELQYIEGSELERAWRASRRQKQKQQEERIWDEFVKEHDIVTQVCEDDPYQFLEQLPEGYLKEIMDNELVKMKDEQEVEKEDSQESTTVVEINEIPLAKEPQHTVTFSEDQAQDTCEMFHIFDDENDASGGEEDILNETLDSPCTVRERQDDLTPLENATSKSGSGKSENVTTLIESSIYCAKVKELRLKINEEILAIVDSVTNKSLVCLEPEDIIKMRKRSTEFCTRFNRIHLYQLQRQLQDVKRNNGVVLPFARHTQFQSQMVRVVSLHHNILAALQAFHKSFSQTSFLSDSPEMLVNVSNFIRECNEVCSEIAQPHQLSAASNLYEDDTEQNCGELEKCLRDYSEKSQDLLKHLDTNSNKNCRSKRPSTTAVSRKKMTALKPMPKSNAETKLSMYALDSLKINLYSKGSTKDGMSSASSVVRRLYNSNVNKTESTTSKEKLKTARKTPRSRRPLMRDPNQGQPKTQTKPLPKDTDIQTMVEVMDTCRSGHVSGNASPKRNEKISPKTRVDSPKVTPKNKTISKRSPKISPMKPLTPRTQIQEVETVECVEEICVLKVEKRNEGDEVEKSPKEKERKTTEVSSREVSRILKSLCTGDNTGNRSDRNNGAKNVQLLCMSASSPRQPSTPQLLRILEETIQKKTPRQSYQTPLTEHQKDRLRLQLNVGEKTAEAFIQHRTKFVQHMLTSAMYANNAVGKPWEVVGSVSDQIIDDLLLQCAKEMQLQDFVQDMYDGETC